jgi:drug/metabolite transporter (DMT)-like permease
MHNNTTKGILLSLVGTALFTPIFAAGKIADGAYPAIALMSMRYLGGFLTVTAAIIVTRTPVATLRSPRPAQHLLRAMLGTGGGVCTIHAASVIPIAYATAIGLTEGLLIVALAGLLLRERIMASHWVAGSVAAIGAYLVVLQSLRETGSASANLEGVVFAAAGAVFIALEVLMIKVLARREKALGVLLHVNGFGTLVVFALSLFVVDWSSMLSIHLLPFILLGPLAITAQLFNILAFRHADAATLGPVSYSWILFATIMGVLFFNEVPAPTAIVGATLIVAAGLIASRIPANNEGVNRNSRSNPTGGA